MLQGFSVKASSSEADERCGKEYAFKDQNKRNRPFRAREIFVFLSNKRIAHNASTNTSGPGQQHVLKYPFTTGTTD